MRTSSQNKDDDKMDGKWHPDPTVHQRGAPSVGGGPGIR